MKLHSLARAVKVEGPVNRQNNGYRTAFQGQQNGLCAPVEKRLSSGGLFRLFGGYHSQQRP